MAIRYLDKKPVSLYMPRVLKNVSSFDYNESHILCMREKYGKRSESHHKNCLAQIDEK